MVLGKSKDDLLVEIEEIRRYCMIVNTRMSLVMDDIKNTTHTYYYGGKVHASAKRASLELSSLLANFRRSR